MRVVGGVWPSMPIRTPFTPSLSTLIWTCEVAATVLGRSTTMRAGIVQRAQLRRHLPAGGDLHADAVVGAHHVHLLQCGVLRSVRARALRLSRAAISASTSSGSKTASSCFRISLLPTGFAAWLAP